MMPKTWFWCAVSLMLAGAPAAAAATVLEKTVAVNIQPDGVVREHTHLAVRLDTAGDVESWSTYPIYLDENRSLEQVGAGSASSASRLRRSRPTRPAPNRPASGWLAPQLTRIGGNRCFISVRLPSCSRC